VARIDFKQFDYLWLGGDLAENSSKDSSSIMYLDTVFDLQSHNTFWSAGNHDYVHSELIRDITSRETFYFVKKNGLMIVVIDTQLDQCHIGGQQKSMLESALKNIAGSTHLILLHHKLIWMYNDEVLEMQIDSVSNAPVGDCIFCIYPNNFNQEIYPMLVEIRSQGIEVICIGGDIGKKTSEFEYVTPEGIHFLASGINANEAGNKALLFEHDRETDQLSWKYVLLTDLQQQYPGQE
jgi:hypothetical protein